MNKHDFRYLMLQEEQGGTGQLLVRRTEEGYCVTNYDTGYKWGKKEDFQKKNWITVHKFSNSKN